MLKLSKIYDSIIKEGSIDWTKEVKKQHVKVANDLGLKLSAIIGSGNWGIVYEIANEPEKVFKVTTDNEEYRTAIELEGKKSEYLANIYKVFEIDEDYVGIIMEKLDKLSHGQQASLISFYRGIKKCTKMSKNDRYEISKFLYDGIDKDFISCLKKTDPMGLHAYKDLLKIAKEFNKHQLEVPTDIHKGNLGSKNGHLAMFDIR